MPDNFKLHFHEDERHATLELIDPDGTAVSVVMDAADMDTLIEAFGAVRAAMKEPVPERLDPQPRLQRTDYPNWWVFDPAPEGHSLALRHPGFGWLVFLLGAERAAEIAGYLLRPLGDTLRLDPRKPIESVDATTLGVARYYIGRTETGHRMIGFQTSSGSTLFFAIGMEEARTMARAILDLRPGQ